MELFKVRPIDFLVKPLNEKQLGSILFGIIVFGKEFYNNGAWQWSGFLWVVYGAVGFGVLFHILFSGFIKEKESNSKNETKEK